jgi:hypothetical protein
MLMPVHDVHFKESTNTLSNLLEEIKKLFKINLKTFCLFIYILC